VQELGKAAPWRCAFVPLNLVEPQLGTRFHVVGGHPNLLLFYDALSMEVGLTAIDEREWVGLAIILGEIHLLDSRQPAVVVFAEKRRFGAQGRRCRPLLLKRVDLGLQQRFDEGREIHGGGLGHRRGDGCRE